MLWFWVADTNGRLFPFPAIIFYLVSQSYKSKKENLRMVGILDLNLWSIFTN